MSPMTFDLEKARAGIAHYRIENTSNVDTESALKELVDQANLAEEYLAEIERLRPFEIAARDLDSDLTKIAGERDDQAARIKELESSLAEIERLRASLIDLHAEYINTLEKNPDCSAWDLDEQSDADQRRLRRNAAHAISITEPPIYLQAEQQAARIQELEEALVENLAADIAYDDRLLWSRLDGQRQDEYREKARQQLQAGGKIGTGARPPCWQITEERKAAIWHAVAVLKENDPDDEHLWDEEIAVLRAMLEGAGQ